ncbi:class I SAM-dependent methyltransferase [Mesorhizobium mediterraneum]|uniref:class I SAM-dependent methyltransferase n=1 Tax=Mesorhizobium mediterraneum TaxID=43617 RepID=UPI001780F710|nr:class I SAM-dependent methyltransferase [Mesorhizobium mediterraneum]
MDNLLAEHAPKIDRDQGTTDPRPYALGYTDGEFKRLELQGALIHDLTEHVLRSAGIGPGMSVLDIGCGVGDVSLLAGKLVGPSGRVLGVDRSAEAVDIAERRATESCQCYWTCFTVGELDTFSPDETFDAVIGRLVLMYLPDPAATLRRLAGYLRPGGIIAFQEMAMALARSFPEAPLFSKCRGWIIETIERAGFEVDMGGRLPMVFAGAGLPAPQMNSAGLAGSGPDSPIYDYIAGTLRSLLPMAEAVGVATAAEMKVDTLAERLRSEAVEQQMCIMLPPLSAHGQIRRDNEPKGDIGCSTLPSSSARDISSTRATSRRSMCWALWFSFLRRRALASLASCAAPFRRVLPCRCTATPIRRPSSRFPARLKGFRSRRKASSRYRSCRATFSTCPAGRSTPFETCRLRRP